MNRESLKRGAKRLMMGAGLLATTGCAVTGHQNVDLDAIACDQGQITEVSLSAMWRAGSDIAMIADQQRGEPLPDGVVPGQLDRIKRIGKAMLGAGQKRCEQLGIEGCEEAFKKIKFMVEPGGERWSKWTARSGYGIYFWDKPRQPEGHEKGLQRVVLIGSHLAARLDDRELAAVIGHEMGEHVQLLDKEGKAERKGWGARFNRCVRWLWLRGKGLSEEDRAAQAKEMWCDHFGNWVAADAGYGGGGPGMMRKLAAMTLNKIRTSDWTADQKVDGELYFLSYAHVGKYPSATVRVAAMESMPLQSTDGTTLREGEWKDGEFVE